MGLLISTLFTTPKGDPSLDKLEACLVRDSAHITPGSRGDHVKRIQIALNQLTYFPRVPGWNSPRISGPSGAAKQTIVACRRLAASVQQAGS